MTETTAILAPVVKISAGHYETRDGQFAIKSEHSGRIASDVYWAIYSVEADGTLHRIGGAHTLRNARWACAGRQTVEVAR